MTPPPHVRRVSTASLYCERAISWRDSNLALSSLFTSVRATTEVFFWCTRVPRRPRLFTIMYGTSMRRHRAGSQTTSSMGSTSEAITTSWAFFCSISVVTWFRPNLSTAPGPAPAVAPASAAATKRAFFSARVSGEYLLSRRNSSAAWFFSSVRLNWLIAGGTFRRWNNTLRWRWMRMYRGQRTKRPTSRVGCTSAPMRNDFGVDG
mmetsp:Transcript_19878/g.46555  ORF Transcript_19878/g.46555 Transcript_19878/m.46555 type:complete len:206 (+) Transcript_19878:232-849(+)